MVNSPATLIPVTTGVIGFSVCLTLLTYCELITPSKLLFHKSSIINKHEFWRLITSQLYLGELGISSAWNVYLIKTYLEELEMYHYKGTKALLLRVFIILFVTAFFNLFCIESTLLSTSFEAAISYLWARMSNANVSFMFIRMKAIYIPWIILLISIFNRTKAINYFVGMLLGHTIHYFDQTLPELLKNP